MTNFADSTRSGNAEWPLALFASAGNGDVTIARLSRRRHRRAHRARASIAADPSFYPRERPALVAHPRRRGSHGSKSRMPAPSSVVTRA